MKTVKVKNNTDRSGIVPYAVSRLDFTAGKNKFFDLKFERAHNIMLYYIDDVNLNIIPFLTASKCRRGRYILVGGAKDKGHSPYLHLTPSFLKIYIQANHYTTIKQRQQFFTILYNANSACNYNAACIV